MPVGQPQVGEVWSTLDPATQRSVQALISEIVSNVITLVSLSGNRVRVAPDRFERTWAFVQGPPLTHLRCQSCGQAASLTFNRGQSPEFVCPRHMPTGIRATLVTDSPPDLLATASQAAPTRSVLSCPFCERDQLIPQLAADLRDLSYDEYQCGGCNARFVYQQEALFDQVPRLLARRPQINEAQLGPDAFRRAASAGDEADFSRAISASVQLFNVRAVFNSRLENAIALRYAAHTAPVARLEPPRLQPPPRINSRWLTKKTGTVVEVIRVTDDAVHFQSVTDGNRSLMTRDDFYEYHREQHVNTTTPEGLFSVGDEWTLIAPSGAEEVYRIVEKAGRMETFIIEDADGKRSTLRFADIQPNQWRKLVRPDLYDRLLAKDIFED